MKGVAITVKATATIIAGSSSEGSALGDTGIAARALAGPGATSYPTAVLIRVPSGSQTVYFGGEDVTTSTGCPFVAGEDLEVDLVNEILWAVVASGTQTVNVLRRGN